jgi:hypothetical protein
MENKEYIISQENKRNPYLPFVTNKAQHKCRMDNCLPVLNLGKPRDRISISFTCGGDISAKLTSFIPLDAPGRSVATLEESLCFLVLLDFSSEGGTSPMSGATFFGGEPEASGLERRKYEFLDGEFVC